MSARERRCRQATLPSALLLVVTLFCAASNAVCPQDLPGITPWSTWAGKPTAGSVNETITVPAGTVLLLDESPPLLKQLTILGQLVVHPTMSITLDAYKITVRDDGHFWVGSAACPVSGNVVITLYGARLPELSPESTGTKSLGVVSGWLDMHGTARTPSWTTLSAPALANATIITLSEEVDWQVGDKFFIAGTDFEINGASANTVGAAQSERRVVTGRPAPNQVEFASQPLLFSHYAGIWSSPDGKDKVEMRAEVGVMTRNVVVKGDSSSLASRWGAHIIILVSGHARISNIEVLHAGQSGEQGRYPIHFHLAEDQSVSFVKGVAFHDTFQRCLTLHGTSNMLASRNTAHNVTGHCFFIEDGNEQNNVLHANLVVGVLKHTLLLSDSEPSCFWITNPLNHFYDNHAVACSIGFWYAMPLHPLGAASSQTNVWLRNVPMGDFKRNVAHSCDSGLFLDRGQANQEGLVRDAMLYSPRNWTAHIEVLAEDMTAEEIDTKIANDGEYTRSVFGKPQLGLVEDFTVWKCTGNGMWGRGSRQVHIVRARLLDNIIGCTFPGDNDVMEDSVFVGETDNVGDVKNCLGCPSWYADFEGRTRPLSWYPWQRIVGWQNYDLGASHILLGNRFYHFNDFQFKKNGAYIRKASAISGQSGPNTLPPTTRILASTFVDVGNVIYFREKRYSESNTTDLSAIDNAVRGSVIVDFDGSLTGTCGSQIVGPGQHLRTPACIAKPSWNAWVCPPNQNAHRSFFIKEAKEPMTKAIGERGSMVDRMLLHLINIGTGVKSTMYPQINAVDSTYTAPSGSSDMYASVEQIYTSNIIVNQEYLVVIGNASASLPSFLVAMMAMQRDEWVRFAFPYPKDSTFSQFKDWGSTAVPSATSLAALVASGADGWVYDSSTQLLWVQLVREADSFDYLHGYPLTSSNDRATISATCPKSSCTLKAPSKVNPNIGVAGPVAKLCEANGAFINGLLTPGAIPAAGADRFEFFSEKFLPSYGHNSNSMCKLTTAMSFEGNSSYYCNWKRGYGWVSIQNWYDKTKTIDISPYTHLVVHLLNTPNLGGFSNLLVQLQWNNTAELRTTPVPVVAPTHSGEGPFTADKWSAYYIPLEEFRLPFKTLSGVHFSTDSPNPTKIYFDNIWFVKMAVSMSSQDTGYPGLTKVLSPTFVDLDDLLTTRLGSLASLPASSSTTAAATSTTAAAVGISSSTGTTTSGTTTGSGAAVTSGSPNQTSSGMMTNVFTQSNAVIMAACIILAFVQI